MFNGFYLTYKGQEYIAKSLTGKTLVFTRGQFGNGSIGSGIPNERTSLVSALGDLTISKKTTSENRVTVTTQFSNKVNGSILPAFYLTEAGIYGKVLNADGTTDSEEVLIAYAYCNQSEADYVQQVLTEFVLNWPMVISSEADVQVVIDDSLAYPTLAEFEENALISRTGTVEVLRGTNYATSNLSEEKGMVGLSIYGKSLQDGTPTPVSPVEIVSVDSPEVKVYRKNLLKNTVAVGTVVGVTRTLNEDGSFVLDGTATETGGVAIGQLPLYDGAYILSGGTKDAVFSIWGRSIVSGEWKTVATESGQGVMFEADKSLHDRYLAQYHVASGKSFSNQTFYPMIRLAESEDSTFVPYEEPKTLSVPHTLRGIPVSSGGNYTDADGQQWLCDEVDLERGVVVQRTQIITVDGTENWTEHSSGRFYAQLESSDTYLNKFVLCSHVTHSASSGSGYYGSVGSRGIYFNKNDVYETLDELTAFLKANSVTFVVALATPVEIPLTADILNTHYPVTNIFVADGIDVDFEANIRTRSYSNEKRMLDRKKLLWENASPSSQFKAQTLDMDLSDYDSVEIEYTNFASTEQLILADKKDVVKNRLVPLVSWNNLDSSGNNIVVRSRVVTATDGGVEFKTAYGKGTTETSVEQSNTYIIPIKIYGIKGVQ